MKEETFAKCTKFEDTYFEGYHQGYLKKLNIIHKRKIELKNKNIEIKDFIENLKGIICLNLHPEVKVIEIENGIKLLKNNIEIFLGCSSKLLKIKKSKFSNKYGDIVKNTKIEIEFEERNILKLERKNGN